MQEKGTGASQELFSSFFNQLMVQIEKQDDLIHSWTKYYLSIQSALAVALAFLLQQLAGSGSDFVVKAGLLFIPVLGISTTWCFTDVIVREHIWQGHYIRVIRKLQSLPNFQSLPQIYDSDPTPGRPGYIARRFLFLRVVLISGWSCLMIILIYSWIVR